MDFLDVFLLDIILLLDLLTYLRESTISCSA